MEKNGHYSYSRFINKGFGEVKFLNIQVEENDEFELICCEDIYVGNVDSDDYETAELKKYLLSSEEEEQKEQTIPIKVRAQYRDANNKMYEDIYELPLEILDGEKLGMIMAPMVIQKNSY